MFVVLFYEPNGLYNLASGSVVRDSVRLIPHKNYFDSIIVNSSNINNNNSSKNNDIINSSCDFVNHVMDC